MLANILCHILVKEIQRGQKSINTRPGHKLRSMVTISIYNFSPPPRVLLTGYYEENNIKKLIKKMTARVSNK